MDESEISEYITRTFPDVETSSAQGYTFFFYRSERKLPFTTVATSDNPFDRASHLERPGVYRLNIGVGRDTYRRLLGPDTPELGPAGVVDTGHDFTQLNRILPHPVYAPQSWVAVLNPSRETFRSVEPLIAEAYQRAVNRAERAAAADRSAAGQ